MTTPTTTRKKTNYCALRAVPPRVFPPGVNLDRQRLILVGAQKWVNGTQLHYHFMEDAELRGDSGELEVVRGAFRAWKDLGLGLEFSEVSSPLDAEIRIGFLRDDGAWSYVGRDVLGIGRNDRTMNFGWNIAQDPDTALHEIGHTLGFPHEHQNPRAGIVWDEEKVYAALAQPPNRWSRETTFHNIIRKISPDVVQGSTWDPHSIMHYPFEAGLIIDPEEYRQGLQPAGGLSERDIAWARTFYPALGASDYQVLTPFQSQTLDLGPTEQRNFLIRPTSSRWFTIQTFGASDTVVVLFERDADGALRYMDGDDDSGTALNARIETRLRAGREYVLRIRLYYADAPQETAVMIW